MWQRSFFQGEWSLSRRIVHSHTRSLLGRVEGHAVFQPFLTTPTFPSSQLHAGGEIQADSDLMIYTENGLFYQSEDLKGPGMNVHKSYFYEFPKSLADDEECRVYFVQEPSSSSAGGESLHVGHLFHNIKWRRVREMDKFLIKGVCTSHLCGRDVYQAAFSVDLEQNAYTMVVQVSGPTKEYAITTQYKRIVS